jgi:hypothetical protein
MVSARYVNNIREIALNSYRIVGDGYLDDEQYCGDKLHLKMLIYLYRYI